MAPIMTIVETQQAPSPSSSSSRHELLCVLLTETLGLQLILVYCVLNVAVAVILNAFTWVYALEPSEITSTLVLNSEHLLHFKVSST